jgi:hypothetical protein
MMQVWYGRRVPLHVVQEKAAYARGPGPELNIERRPRATTLPTAIHFKVVLTWCAVPSSQCTV